MQKMLFIVNQKAGRGMISPVLADVLTVFSNADFEVTVHMTKKDEDLPQFVAQNAGRFDIVVASGGDGTLNQTVNGLMLLENRPKLGFLPAGTTNDVASNLALPKKIIEAAKVITQGHFVPLDIGSFNNKFFDYIAAFGNFAQVSFETPREAKNVIGSLAYVMEVIKLIPTVKPFYVHIETDSRDFDGEILLGMVSNSRYMAGFPLGEKLDASINDGMMEVVLIKKFANAAALPQILNSYLAGDIADDENIFWCQTKNVRITTKKSVPWTIDGENAGRPKQVNISNIMHAIEIAAPKAATEQ